MSHEVKEHAFTKFTSFIGHLSEDSINDIILLGLSKLMEYNSVDGVVVTETLLIGYHVKNFYGMLWISLTGEIHGTEDDGLEEKEENQRRLRQQLQLNSWKLLRSQVAMQSGDSGRTH
ncbi:hypothetical protein RJ640_016938 [Escallonia rubra]|uniref:Uncharacterized protein n=1 Tax=Escallonia rubra TaxID=112253 RepID=A0AA88RYP2_9ASTE|nr:hypothetical protein RJ640_016938 [Escallonia rubra]